MGYDSNVNQVSLEVLFIPSPFLTSVCFLGELALTKITKLKKFNFY